MMSDPMFKVYLPLLDRHGPFTAAIRISARDNTENLSNPLFYPSFYPAFYPSFSPPFTASRHNSPRFFPPSPRHGNAGAHASFHLLLRPVDSRLLPSNRHAAQSLVNGTSYGIHWLNLFVDQSSLSHSAERGPDSLPYPAPTTWRTLPHRRRQS